MRRRHWRSRRSRADLNLNLFNRFCVWVMTDDHRGPGCWCSRHRAGTRCFHPGTIRADLNGISTWKMPSDPSRLGRYSRGGWQSLPRQCARRSRTPFGVSLKSSNGSPLNSGRSSILLFGDCPGEGSVLSIQRRKSIAIYNDLFCRGSGFEYQVHPAGFLSLDLHVFDTLFLKPAKVALIVYSPGARWETL